MTSREDCEKWLLEHGWDYDVNNMANILHEFSKSTVGYFKEPEPEDGA